MMGLGPESCHVRSATVRHSNGSTQGPSCLSHALLSKVARCHTEEEQVKYMSKGDFFFWKMGMQKVLAGPLPQLLTSPSLPF